MHRELAVCYLALHEFNRLVRVLLMLTSSVLGSADKGQRIHGRR